MITNKSIRTTAWVTFVVLLLVSITVAYLIAYNGILMAPILLVAVCGIVLLIAVIRDYRVGLYFIFAQGIFGPILFDRIVPIQFPMGTVYDALAALAFIALFIHNRDQREWTLFKNPVTITFIIIIAYQLLQFFNPSATSTFAWLVSLRNNVSFLIYVIFFQMFSKFNDVRRFTSTWVFLATLVAIYAMYQEYIGLPEFEMRWMHQSEARMKLFFQWGRLRKFSVLNDPSSFGLFMGASALTCMVLAMGPFKAMYRWGYAALMGTMLMAMSFSGTRTAIAMVAVGIAFFITITLRDRRTIMAGIGIAFVGAIIFFGPFYGGTINRVRSTFDVSGDNSMEVRDRKRVRLQTYVKTHPIGGGLYTAGSTGLRYSPGHPIAGPWDTDSGYLQIALETGWIGMFIFMTLFFIVLQQGIKFYFSINDPLVQTYILAYIVPFLALSVAHYTQDAMFQKPTNILVYATYALVVRIPSFEKKLYSVDLV